MIRDLLLEVKRTLNQAIDWAIINVNIGFIDPVDPNYFFFLVAGYGFGGGPGIRTTLMFHFETPSGEFFWTL